MINYSYVRFYIEMYIKELLIKSFNQKPIARNAKIGNIS